MKGPKDQKGSAMNERTSTPKISETEKRKSSSQNGDSHLFQSVHSPLNQITHLQRAIGNQAIQSLFGSGILQAKLIISQPNDLYEQEADRVADEMMRMPEPVIQPKPI
jgi:hypothetical protein